MKEIFSLILIVIMPVVLMGQNGKNHSVVEVKGNSNIIKVIQVGVVQTFDLNDEKQATLFLSYLRKLPNIDKEIKQLLNKADVILDLVQKMYAKSNDDGLLNPAKLKEQLALYIEENKKLRIENAELRKSTVDASFAEVLLEAGKKLEQFDNEGYQKVLENYKIAKRQKNTVDLQELSTAAYLQAKNSEANYYYRKALDQISESLVYNHDNPYNIAFQGKIQFELFLYDDCIATYLKVLSASLPDTERFITLNEIGKAFKETGRYSEAIEFFNRSFHIVETSSIKPFPNVFSAYENIAGVYADKQIFDTALVYYLKSKEALEKAAVHSDLNMALVYNEIGSCYSNKHDTVNALIYYNKALALFQQVYGNDHEYVGTVINNIGMVYETEGDFNKAESSYRKANAIIEKKLGYWHPLTAVSFGNIGTCLEKQNKTDSALVYQSKSLNILRKVLGENSAKTAIAYQNLGFTYSNLGNTDESFFNYRSAIDIRKKLFGDQDDLTKRLYQAIGTIFIASGDINKGLEYWDKSNVGTVMTGVKAWVANSSGAEQMKRKRFKEAGNFLKLAEMFLDQSNADTVGRKIVIQGPDTTLMPPVIVYQKQDTLLLRTLNFTVNSNLCSLSCQLNNKKDFEMYYRKAKNAMNYYEAKKEERDALEKLYNDGCTWKVSQL